MRGWRFVKPGFTCYFIVSGLFFSVDAILRQNAPSNNRNLSLLRLPVNRCNYSSLQPEPQLSKILNMFNGGKLFRVAKTSSKCFAYMLEQSTHYWLFSIFLPSARRPGTASSTSPYLKLFMCVPILTSSEHKELCSSWT